MKQGNFVNGMVFGPASMPAIAIVANEYSDMDRIVVYSVDYTIEGETTPRAKTYYALEEATMHDVLTHFANDVEFELEELISISISKKN